MPELKVCEVNHPAGSDIETLLTHYANHEYIKKYLDVRPLDIEKIKRIYNQYRMHRRQSLDCKEAIITFCLECYFPFAYFNKTPKGYNPHIDRTPQFEDFLQHISPLMDPSITFHEKFLSTYIYKSINKGAVESARLWFSLEGIVTIRLLRLITASLKNVAAIEFTSYPSDSARWFYSLEEVHAAEPSKKRGKREASKAPQDLAPEKKRRKITFTQCTASGSDSEQHSTQFDAQDRLSNPLRSAAPPILSDLPQWQPSFFLVPPPRPAALLKKSRELDPKVTAGQKML